LLLLATHVVRLRLLKQLQLVGGVNISTNEYNVNDAGRLEGKRPLGRHRCRWVYNIQMNLKQ
jgi:hypothetical protein